MDILFVDTFIQSSLSYFPLGINLLSTIVNTTSSYTSEVVSFSNLILEKKLPTTILLENNFETIVQYILDKNSKIISFYTLSEQYYISLIVAEKIKKINKDIKIVFAGPQASLLSSETLDVFDFIDLIAVGEGEQNIISILDYFNNKEEIENVKGVCYRKQNNIVCNEPSPLIYNLDKLPMIELDMGTIPNNFYIESGRGCPYNCTFCSTKTFWKRKVRLKSVHRIIEEVKYYTTKYNIKKIDFVHDLFTANKKHVLEFCNKLVDLDMDIKWMCRARLDTLDEEMVDRMAKSGCYKIGLGIETGSQRMQKEINKNLELSNFRDKMRMINSYVPIQVCLIYGLPTERKEDLLQTMDLVRFCVEEMLVKIIQMNKCRCYPGSHMYLTQKDNLVFKEKNISLYNYPTKNHVDFIKSYPNLFSGLYTIKNEVLDKYFYLDTFINYIYLSVIHKIPKTMNEIISYYNNSLLDFYLEYEDEVKRVETLLVGAMYYGEKIVDVIEEIFNGFENFVKHKMKSEFIIQLFQFEVEIMRVSLDSESYKSKVLTFDYDMLKYYKELSKKKEECKIAFTALEDKTVSISRVM